MSFLPLIVVYLMTIGLIGEPAARGNWKSGADGWPELTSVQFLMKNSAVKMVWISASPDALECLVEHGADSVPIDCQGLANVILAEDWAHMSLHKEAGIQHNILSRLAIQFSGGSNRRWAATPRHPRLA